MKNLYWFTHDLRITDNHAFNHALNQASAAGSQLTCVYIDDKRKQSLMSEPRLLFLEQSLGDLKHRLNHLGCSLLRVALNEDMQSPADALADTLNGCIRDHDISQVHAAAQAGSYERQAITSLNAPLNEYFNQTLWQPDELPFVLADLPGSFSKARKLWESNDQAMAKMTLEALCQNCPATFNYLQDTTELASQYTFLGGESSALQHLWSYFETNSASHYKQTRNALDGWGQSTKFSPWLAFGCLSPRQVMTALRLYEQKHGANESTYWIFFELLWREYFFWYARLHQARVFSRNGLKGATAYQIKHDPQALMSWQKGQTDFPLVNACMKQLNATGYMSNRGRQLVASCLVNELQLDWRLGAAYFERQLIDYDVASNWGNWQYLGGVGADPRGLRRFDQDKQQRIYDPYGEFIKRWQGYVHID